MRKMNRPKKEELKDIREIGGIYTIDFTRYIDALEKYVDQLEKALDKACEIMTDRVNIDSGNGKPTIGFTEKEWLMNNETI